MLRRYDKGGEQFYDTISALHKAVRGCDPDASLYWFVRMLDGGVDPRYAARRIVRMASEDIGLADPRALRIALDAAEVYERLGSPEGELALAEAVVYLAVAPKINAVYTACNAARAFVAQRRHPAGAAAPAQCADRLMKELDYGKRLPLRARRGRRLRRRRALLARRHGGAALLRAGRRAASSMRIGERLARVAPPRTQRRRTRG